MAKEMGSGSHKASMIISGLLLIVLGAMWWMGKWNMDKTLSALLILWGVKKLYWSTQKGYCC